MTPPANTPDASVPSETLAEVAVTTQPAAALEDAAGMQSLTPEARESTWEEDLAAMEALEASGEWVNPNGNDQQAAPQAVADPTNPEAAGIAAAEQGTVEPGDEKHGPQHRIRPRSETDAAVLKLMSRNADMTLEEALAKVKGPSTPEQQEAQAEVVPAPVAAASTLDALIARQEEMTQELQAAYADMDFEKVGELQAESLRLIEAKMKAEAAQRVAEAETARDWDRQVQEAEAKALALYPAVEAPNSALYAKMEAIHETLSANDDPLIHNPNYAFKLAQMAAGELGIAPKTVTPAPAAAQAAPAHRASMPQIRPAAGGNVSGAVTTAAQVAQASAMDNWTAADWDAAMQNGTLDKFL